MTTISELSLGDDNSMKFANVTIVTIDKRCEPLVQVIQAGSLSRQVKVSGGQGINFSATAPQSIHVKPIESGTFNNSMFNNNFPTPPKMQPFTLEVGPEVEVHVVDEKGTHIKRLLS